MNPLKSLLYSSLVLITLLAVVSCSCENPTGPDNGTNPTNTGPITPTNGSIPIERPLFTVSSPENSITRTVSIDTNILDLYLSSGYNPDDFSVTHLDGVDVGIINTASLTIDESAKTISGLIELNQRLDFENPSDGGENSGDNDYEVAIFRVMSATSINDFKLIVRITDAADPQKLEILIDSYHLDDINQQRGIREVYLYEDSGATAPLMGNDSNNFLTSTNLVENTSFLGDVDVSTDLTKLYDQDDRVDAFLTATAVNSNSKTYHRISLEFTEEVYIEKVAIRGRQIGGYYGFVFILRDKNDHIISVHQASNPLSRGSGSDETAISTYDFVPDYNDSRHPITNFGISLDNMYFDIAENSTNVILVDNFFVAPGYEYERGFVTIDPGADIDKFNTNDLYFLNNELIGLSFKTAPNAEDEQDADGDNTYEVGTVSITNVDGGRLNFALPVRVVNVPPTVSFLSNHVYYSVEVGTSVIVSNLVDLVHPSNFNNALNLGERTYIYELIDSNSYYSNGYFEIHNNSLRAVKGRGGDAFNNIEDPAGEFNIAIRYTADGGANAVLSMTILVNKWHVSRLETAWGDLNQPRYRHNGYRANFQAVVLKNNAILVMGGFCVGSLRNDIWLSSSYYDITWNRWNNFKADWSAREYFQAVVLKNDHILVMGGHDGTARLNDIWLSSDRGVNWANINASAPWTNRSSFQAVVLKNDHILVMGGHDGITRLNDIWLSTNGGTNWININASAPWANRSGFQAVVLTNNDVLVMGGDNNDDDSRLNDIWISKNGGTNWSEISASEHWTNRVGFQATVLKNNDILIHGGLSGGDFQTSSGLNDTWISKDGGTNWNNITPPPPSAFNKYFANYLHNYRYNFQLVTLPEENSMSSRVLIMGGSYKKVWSDGARATGSFQDIWLHWRRPIPVN